MTNAISITMASLELFKAYAADAGNWSGTPMVGEWGNVAFTKEDRGNLTQLKKAGLVKTFSYEGCMWLEFTDAGKAFAAENGITIAA